MREGPLVKAGALVEGPGPTPTAEEGLLAGGVQKPGEAFEHSNSSGHYVRAYITSDMDTLIYT